MISASNEAWQQFGRAVALALIESHLVTLREVTAEDVFFECGTSARFGCALSNGLFPVALDGAVCLITPNEARRYQSEFLTLPSAL